MKKLKARYRRWLRFYRLRRVPRRTYVVATTHDRAIYAAKQRGLNPRSRSVQIISGPTGYRSLEGLRMLPGDKVVMYEQPKYIGDILIRNLISSGTGVKSRNLVDFEVIR